MKKLAYDIGDYCRNFRVEILNMTLKEVAGDESLKTLSGFENARSTNVRHLEKYMNACPDLETKKFFMVGLIEVIEGGRKNESDS